VDFDKNKGITLTRTDVLLFNSQVAVRRGHRQVILWNMQLVTDYIDQNASIEIVV
jgi:hypothetical protein